MPDLPTRLSMHDALARAAAHQLGFQTIVDVGASNGQWSRLAMKFFPHLRYLLLEPLTEQKDSLEAFKAQNRNVDFLLAAAADHMGEVPFHVSADLDGSLVTADPAIGVERKVRAVTIDSEVRALRLPRPYAIKLDTHGYEVPILRGAGETLRQTNLLIIEVYNFSITETCLRFHEIMAHVEKLGFRCFDMADVMLREGDRALWQMDLFFARKESHIFESNAYR